MKGFSRIPPHGRRPPRLPPVSALSALLLLGTPVLPGFLGANAPGFFAVGAAAQTLPPSAGTLAAGLLLRQMDGVKRVLMIAAHPDDEDTSLLAQQALGVGARVAYLSLSRGEGGQNLIGPELDEGMGVIRTGELDAARHLDGAEQYFTRAFDFGFSKTAEESLGHWPLEELVADAVEVIRAFRPHVVVSIFSGTPRDGHGQHQVAGMVAEEAFSAAGDPERFPEQLREGVEAWAPLKLYRRIWGPSPPEALRLSTGVFDPLLGRSWFQVAMESRSQHRSQDMGAPQTPGPRESALHLVASRVDGDPGAAGLWAGIDTTLVGTVEGLPGEVAAPVRDALQRYREAVALARRELGALDPSGASPALATALAAIREAGAAAASHPTIPLELQRVLREREALAERALLASAGVVVETRVERELVVPGESLEVELLVWNGGPFPVTPGAAGLHLPRGWITRALEGPGGVETITPGELATWRYAVSLPTDAPPSRLYFLQEEREGALYRWPDDPAVRGLPRDPPPVVGEVALELHLPSGEGRVHSAATAARAAGGYVGVDKATGEFREPLLVVPALSVTVDPGTMAWPLGEREPRTVTLRVLNQAQEGTRGEVALEVPAGWTVEPTAHRVEFVGAGGGRNLSFRVTPPEGMEEGHLRFRGVARTAAGREYREGFTLIEYPHVERAALFHPAEARVVVLPVQVATGLRVGYIMGAGDEGAEALRQMGASVELLGAAEVLAGDYSRFHTVVLGARAYEVRQDLIAANAALLDFASKGGTVVVQYNKYEYPEGNFAPYPVAMRRPHHRVTDPEAEVTFLDPASPALTYPNRLGPSDFQGWVQERGLYFLAEWEGPWTPLLEMADPGEEPTRGSLVVAPVGDGLYAYTGLALFRQLPAGVPGAYRLLANLASLRADDWHRHTTAASRGDR